MTDLCPLPDISSTFQLFAWIAVVFLSLLFRHKQVKDLDLLCARRERSIAALQRKLEAAERENANWTQWVKTGSVQGSLWDETEEDWVF